MKNKLFDQFVKEQLSESRPEVPAGVWESIERELHRDRNRFVPFWLPGFLKVAAVLILTGGLAWYLLSENKSASEAELSVAKNIPSDNMQPAGVEESLLNSAVNNGIRAQSDDLNLNKALPVKQASGKEVRVSSVSRFNMEHEPAIAIVSGEENFSPESSASLSKYQQQQSLLASAKRQQRLLYPRNKFGLNIPCPEAERNAAGNKKYIEVYAGPDLAFNQFSDLKDPAYATRRKKSISTMLSYSAGVRFTKVFGSGISVRGGLNVTRVNQSFSSEQGKVMQNVYITNHEGDTTGTYSVTGTQYTKNTNRFTLIDIPVTAGYEFGNGRVHTNIYAGVMVNVRNRFEGNVIDRSDKAIEVSNGSGAYDYKTKAGTSLTAGASIYYKLNDKLHLMAEPYIRYGMSSVTPDESTLKEKIHIAGLRAGLRLDL